LGGSWVVFTPSGPGVYTAPSHVLAKLVKNVDGTWTYFRRSKEIFTFEVTGKLASIEDLNGDAVALVWDTSGKLATVTDDGGRAITFTYGSNGKVATATDPANRVMSYGYDAAGRLETVTLPGNRTTTYIYDASYLITSMTDPRGSVTVNTYDQASRVTKLQAPPVTAADVPVVQEASSDPLIPAITTVPASGSRQRFTPGSSGLHRKTAPALS
jgi:YD repeat-containing protein